MVRRAAAFAFLVCACSGAGDRGGTPKVKLRVSTSHGFGELVPGDGPRVGASAYVLPLVFDPIEKHARIMSLEGRSVLLERKADSAHEADELAATLRYRGLEAAEAIGGDRIRARFADEETAAEFFGRRADAFDLGPFELTNADEKKITLRSRDEDLAVDVIEVLAVDEEEQWRRLLARNIDVVSMIGAARAARLEEVGSIRLLPFPGDWEYGVIFNTHAPGLEAVASRRAFVRAIDAPALAKIGCGDPACASAFHPRDLASDSDLHSLPSLLSILVQESDDVALLAAEGLRHQLRRRGVALTLKPTSAPDAFAQVSRGDYELAIVPLSYRLDEKMLSQLAAFGYQNEELSAAIERGDTEAARAILEREVPFVTLFEARYYAALDESFCGARPGDTASWRWLADLHPCDEDDG